MWLLRGLSVLFFQNLFLDCYIEVCLIPGPSCRVFKQINKSMNIQRNSKTCEALALREPLIVRLIHILVALRASISVSESAGYFPESKFLFASPSGALVSISHSLRTL